MKDRREFLYQAVRQYFASFPPEAEVRATDDGQCVYRAPDGKKCAIGCVLPDAVYSDAMEGKGAKAVVRQFPLAAEFLIDGDDDPERVMHFLSRLQTAHDDSDGSAGNIVKRLDDVARSEGVSTPDDERELRELTQRRNEVIERRRLLQVQRTEIDNEMMQLRTQLYDLTSQINRA